MQGHRDVTAKDRAGVIVTCGRLLAKLREGRPRLSVPEPFDWVDDDALVPAYALPYLSDAPSADEVIALGTLSETLPEGWPGNRVRRRP